MVSTLPSIILTILLLFSFTGCSKQEPFEGEICKLEYQPVYTTTTLVPIIISNGKTTTTILVPYIFYYPDRWYVQVREYVGEYEEGKTGRSLESKKRLVIVALEVLPGNAGVGRAYAKVIKQASGDEFKPFFKDYISQDAHVVTDEWKGYLPLKKDYQNLEQRPSEKGRTFPELHIHIMNIQGWLRGIHHHCTEQHLQGYLDEYHYRYNRRNHMDTIFDNLIKRMVEYNPIRRE